MSDFLWDTQQLRAHNQILVLSLTEQAQGGWVASPSAGSCWQNLTTMPVKSTLSYAKSTSVNRNNQYSQYIRHTIHSSHQFFGEVTNQVNNFKSLLFSVSDHQNVMDNSIAINISNLQSQLNSTAHFGDLKQKN